MPPTPTAGLESLEDRILPLDEWKALARKGQAPEDAVLFKEVALGGEAIARAAGEGEGEGGERKLRWTISTEDVDRESDTVSLAGWRLENFEKNPVVLWAHSYRALPIGLAEDTKAEGKQLRSTAEFHPAEINPFAETIYLLAAHPRRFLRTASVGFRPIKYMFNEERRGFDFGEQELLEWSVVPVPANPAALSGAKAAGIDCAPLLDWAVKTLDEWGTGRFGIVVPREKVEGAWKALKGGIVVPVSLGADGSLAIEPDQEKKLVEFLGATVAPDNTQRSADLDGDFGSLLERATAQAKETGATITVRQTVGDRVHEVVVAPPAAAKETPPEDAESVVVLSGEPGDEPADVIDLGLSAEELRGLIRDGARAAMTALTGQLD